MRRHLNTRSSSENKLLISRGLLERTGAPSSRRRRSRRSSRPRLTMARRACWLQEVDTILASFLAPYRSSKRWRLWSSWSESTDKPHRVAITTLMGLIFRVSQRRLTAKRPQAGFVAVAADHDSPKDDGDTFASRDLEDGPEGIRGREPRRIGTSSDLTASPHSRSSSGSCEGLLVHSSCMLR